MNNSDWITRVQKLQLPAVLPLDTLPSASAPLSDWMILIREDPLLTIHLFRYANKMLASNDVSVKTLDQAVTLLGSTRLIALSAKILRVQADSASAKGLLRAIGDSLLAASLMREWFDIRQIPWSEADYWMTLYYDLGLWVIWLLEPEKMESIELGVKQGQNRDTLLRELLGMEPRDWNEQLCLYFQLPILNETVTATSLSDTRLQAYKQTALKFFLPFSHELAFVVRQDWQSEALEALCRTGEISLGLTEFRPMLKRWVTSAAREFKLPHAALAARRLLAQQPGSTLPSRNGFNDNDVALASKLSKLSDADARPKLANAGPAAADLREPPRSAQATERASVDFNEAAMPPSQQKRGVVDLNIQREIRRQFRNQKSWHSPSEIQESALYGLQRGLGLSRIVVLEVRNGFWQVFDSEGCQQHALLRNLKLPIHSSDILMELSKRMTALWVSPSNRQKAEKLLPPPLIAAVAEDHFFLRSFTIGHEITMLLYVDGFNQPEPLNGVDYQLFREYCADWNTALNKMRS